MTLPPSSNNQTEEMGTEEAAELAEAQELAATLPNTLSERERARLTQPGRGRPAMIRERSATIINAIRMGVSQSAACKLAGIHPVTHLRWMKTGRADVENGSSFTEQAKYYLDYVHAEAEAEQRAVAIWQKAMPDDWRAAAEFLRRRFPEEWSTATGAAASATATVQPGKDGGEEMISFTINLTAQQEDAI